MGGVKFDHSGKCSVRMDKTGKFLEQNGNLFTYAEWSKMRKRYVPEPEWVDPTRLSDPELHTMLSAVLYKMNELMESMSALQTAVINNIEKFLDDRMGDKADGKQDKGGDKKPDLLLHAADEPNSKGGPPKRSNRPSRGKNK